MPDYLMKRNGFWQFVRRVPLEFAELDPRGVVKHSTKVAVKKDRLGLKARRIADAMNRELEAYWRGLSEGKSQEASDRYNEARRRFRTLGFGYVEMAELADRPTLEALDREALLDAFDQIGRAAASAGTKLQIAVYGGSALLLASNFRFSTEDVDVSRLEQPLPDWLAAILSKIARQNNWQEDWFNDGVAFHLSSLADRAADHLEFATFPRDAGPPGLVVSVPSAEYLLALKLKAARVMDPLRGETERIDILNLMQVVGISTVEEAIAVLGRYFPVSAASSEKQRFLLKNMNREGGIDAPKYPR
jgi:hypothetical protein